jgi:4-amino-4-deoxy-L-arabinose transferase-like glycosyltransferase
MSATSREQARLRTMAAEAGNVLRSPVWAFVLIFLLSFTVRAALLVSLAESRKNFYRFGSGIEDRVASSLVRTGEFADPYLIPSGPTAHPPPLWPGILALIYSAFGTTATAGYVRGLVAISSYSTLFGLLPWFGRRLGLGTRSGVLAGVVGALIPRQGMDEIIGWGVTANAALALGLVTVAFLHRWATKRSSVTGSLLLGVGCGAAFHVSPPLLLVVLGYLIFELWWKRDRRKWILCASVVAGAILACAPWTWRNYTAFHELLFIRGNLGLELRMANHPGADADGDVTYARQGTVRHPSENLEEARLVRDLGEGEYMGRARSEAIEWIRAHPAEFLRLTLMRVVHFWCGPLRLPWLAALTSAVTVLALLGLRRILPALDASGRAALLIPLATFPLVYYIVSYQAHYPAPLAWLLLLLASYEVQGWIFRENVLAAATESA